MEQEKEKSPSFKMRMALYGIRKKFGIASHISVEETKKKRNEYYESGKVVLFDVREEREYGVSHIPGANWINSSKSMEDQKNDLLKCLKNQENVSEAIVYCSIGYRSSKLIEYILTDKNDEDMPKLINLEGGIFKWVNDGNAAKTNGGNLVNYAHPYNAMWGKLLNDDNRYSES